ncbi:Predicted nucleoside-diphosphate sugar epimerase [Pseudorhizobium banfieldiae]|uniref:Predicted nucleoside-diphosphate sugar epimerase n=1 Tax=Pseudorhizobium banfieldiae TaxID=1125847 RepID=L0NKP5_9HYPH|nr:polysaccharide biosynthesis protein [Pseudorhizobium banfieldiae]CAD6617840.1 nucleoside-diphosphate sugar epimerase [arsenite-oxidising bacterium NT-25]CCF20882.1 Predicted nucleoside-diphosphate sugar epimerase [Pseudorhizobium banfieldiae]
MKHPLHELATGRADSLFEADITQSEAPLRAAITGKRVLAIGGAGSIGSSTVLQIAMRDPEVLHVIDQNENGLAELVRQLRSQPDLWSARDFQTLPLDYGSAAMRHLLASQPPYDLVLNFAALKHVRSEKDPFSTLQMFETNLLKQERLMHWLAGTGFAGRFFTVSTDKAANPSSMMGASKRAMEHVLFNSAAAATLSGTKTSARFANVAFSNGSLLQGFENRLARIEPLAAPRDTRRYFVSLRESGELCVLAAALAPDRTIVIPRLDPERHLVPLQTIAESFLRYHGYEPVHYFDELEACAAVKHEAEKGRWPLLLTALDTSGEKPYEEFTTPRERTCEIGLPNLLAVEYLAADRAAIDAMLRATEGLMSGAFAGSLSKKKLKDVLAMVEPGFLATHKDAIANLDQRL